MLQPIVDVHAHTRLPRIVLHWHVSCHGLGVCLSFVILHPRDQSDDETKFENPLADDEEKGEKKKGNKTKTRKSKGSKDGVDSGKGKKKGKQGKSK